MKSDNLDLLYVSVVLVSGAKLANFLSQKEMNQLKSNYEIFEEFSVKLIMEEVRNQYLSREG